MHENMSAASGRASSGKPARARARASRVPARMSSVPAVVSWTVDPTGTPPWTRTTPVARVGPEDGPQVRPIGVRLDDGERVAERRGPGHVDVGLRGTRSLAGRRSGRADHRVALGHGPRRAKRPPSGADRDGHRELSAEEKDGDTILGHPVVAELKGRRRCSELSAGAASAEHDHSLGEGLGHCFRRPLWVRGERVGEHDREPRGVVASPRAPRERRTGTLPQHRS